MSNHRFTLEDYRQRGQTRFDCPRCNARKSFARYIDSETQKHLGEYVGKCNRESNCQYHYTPKQFFADHPDVKAEMFPRETSPNSSGKTKSQKRKQGFVASVATVAKPFDIIAPNAVKQSLKYYAQNGFASYLFSLIEAKEVDAALKLYLVGSWTNRETVFWQIDSQGRIRTGKLIDYDATTGKRRKTAYSANWIHSELKKTGDLSDDFELNQCFFGEHLLSQEISKPLAIVESEKTAVIASIFVHDCLWLAIGGKSYLKPERLKKLVGRRIVLFPDADGYSEWSETAVNARRMGLDVECSDLIETFASSEEKQKGYDLADYLLSAKITERENSNGTIDEILDDSDLFDAFAERMAIAEFDGNLSPETIERPEFVRAVADYVWSEAKAREIVCQ